MLREDRCALPRVFIVEWEQDGRRKRFGKEQRCGGVEGEGGRRGSVCGGVRGGARGGVGARGGHGEVCVQGTAEARLYQRLKLTSRAALMASCEETQREYNKLQLRNSCAS